MSGKKRGLSHEEKRKRMCEFFYEKKEVMTLKELEKHLPKVKGIVSQTVKDILQSLVDDGLVDSDKIGAGNFFWALPSKALSLKQNKIQSLKHDIDQFGEETEKLNAEARQLLSDRMDSDERAELEISHANLLAENASIDARLVAYDDRNPAKLKELEDMISEAHGAVNRWTDNVFSVVSYISSKNSGLDQASLLQQFGLPADMDNID
uniref:Meiotic nuclear division protein 1 homolog n=1 Tax=Spongospora subterranea TaxID=70186 RepID=A0A0H5QFS2_9EUKA|eukprot:CRZ00903.1 hypothetical protein [Spongospora subterranea]